MNEGAKAKGHHPINGTDYFSLDAAGDGSAIIRLSGAWRLRHGMPSSNLLEQALAAHSPPRRITLDASELAGWDSSLVNFVAGVKQLCQRRAIALDRAGLPPGVNQLLDLAAAVPTTDARRLSQDGSRLVRLGHAALEYSRSLDRFLEFLGLVVIAFGSFVTGRARYRRSDLLEAIQACGVGALGIVTLISYLVGVILAFMGAVQLQQFGASLYVADLVGIGMVREMGAMMTGIIMSGRTGAAFAAQLGTMKVTQEVDALATMGLSPMEFLVIPRIVALVLMMPLLCLYADFLGILGGASVGAWMLGLSLQTYLHQTIHAVSMSGLIGGLFKASVYGVLIALAGCYQGFECGKSSSAVGDAATRAVVSGIVMIVVACGIFAVLFNILGF